MPIRVLVLSAPFDPSLSRRAIQKSGAAQLLVIGDDQPAPGLRKVPCPVSALPEDPAWAQALEWAGPLLTGWKERGFTLILGGQVDGLQSLVEFAERLALDALPELPRPAAAPPATAPSAEAPAPRRGRPTDQPIDERLHRALCLAERGDLRIQSELPALVAELNDYAGLKALQEDARACAELENQLVERKKVEGLSEEVVALNQRIAEAHPLAAKRLEARMRRWRSESRKGERSPDAAASGSLRISDLAPRKSWKLVIDARPEALRRRRGGRRGRDGGGEERMVAVLFPGTGRPPPAAPELPGELALAPTMAAAKGALDQLQARGAGVLGLRVQGEGGRAWHEGALELLRWVLRLLPRDGDTRVGVRIEKGGRRRKAERWTEDAQLLQAELGRQPGKRAGRILLDIEEVEPGSPGVGYGAALLLLWEAAARVASPEDEQALDALAVSLEPTLVDYDGAALRALWEGIEANQDPAPEAWYRLVESGACAQEGSVAAGLAETLAASLRKDGARTWSFQRPLEEALEGSERGLDELALSLTWAAGLRSDRGGSAAVALAGDWIRLRDGVDGAPAIEALHPRCDALLDERPRTVGRLHADMVRRHLDAGELDAAEALLARWRELPPAAGGLQLWAELRSLDGELHAAREDHAAARDSFQAALEAFARLSSRRAASDGLLRAGEHLVAADLALDEAPELLEQHLTVALRRPPEELVRRRLRPRERALLQAVLDRHPERPWGAALRGELPVEAPTAEEAPETARQEPGAEAPAAVPATEPSAEPSTEPSTDEPAAAPEVAPAVQGPDAGVQARD